MQQNPYIKTDWHDHIVDPTQFEKDKDGNIIIDEHTGRPKPKVIQEGTRFTAGRANNIEDGIFNAYAWLTAYYDEMTRLRIQIEMLGRAPTNNGTFFDALDGDTAKQLIRLIDGAVSQHALNAGATTITLDSVPFAVGEQVTIYDDERQESVKVIAVNGNKITIGALTNMYKKGAKVARSNSQVDVARQRLIYGSWGTYSISLVEVV